ncbi:hypothetical protein EW026_g1739 [Hermanssonia centrifuga]|uniref:BHLH domain-containing protein n=1 Tax=Hermanssonia centrifuga TaxID=98765 RepID=A0A4S4KR07_9APHY|nr:hypothetical protein EW026_g1739 [Hermanssonia centrifuga]
MNGDASAHNHKDFLDAFFQQEQPPSHNQSSIDSSDIFQTASASSSGHHSSLGNMQQQSMSNNGLGMDVLEGLMGMQERGGQSGMSSGAQPTPQMLVEQQMRLNQLQQLYQLQTQIFQQQIELLSGQTSFSSLSGTPREQQQYLPTPAQSTELPPQPSPDFVPPMLLQSTEHNVGNMGHHTQHHFIPHQIIPTAPHSAPANIVFQNIQSPYPLPSPAELDFDEMSPLTSPWLVSPGLKPILPAGNISGSMSPTGPLPQPTLQVRKTSHKAAEQKRRDSLKTSFDDLRLLLPPIPLPSEEGYPDEPILPGAMPPRGPPKGNADGPNRGVSKLQLLRCGNDYLRRLKGRVERRDDEIDKLRKEIRRLRIVVGSEYMQTEEEGDGQEPIDLEKDLDAEESSLGPLGRYPGTLYEGDEGDDDGAD